MNKQYNLQSDGVYKSVLKIYHDGKLVETKNGWMDDIADEVDKLEEDGYIYGYTEEEVKTAERRYKRMLKYMIG